MTIGTWWPIAVWYGSRPGASVAFDALIVTTLVSVFAVARPMPGKCFIAGTSWPLSRPVANASDRDAVVEELNDQVRPCWYMNELVEAGTSATGARSLLMPAQARIVPVEAPWDVAVDVLPRLPICGTESVGGAHGTRITEPPSWSVAIRSGGCPPAAAAARSFAVSEASCAASLM